MFYSNNLEEVIFNFDATLSQEPDELIIISGYIGPSLVNRLTHIPYKTFVIGGMYHNGIDQRLMLALNQSKQNNSNLTLKYTDTEIHSKLYVWRKDKQILSALIGSANFSSNGLHSNLREILALVNRGSFPQMQEYINTVTSSLIDQPPLLEEYKTIDLSSLSHSDYEELAVSNSCELPLYSQNNKGTKLIHSKSGINWGRSTGHVAIGDAYIAITQDLIKNHGILFKPYDPKYEYERTKKKRQSEPIEIIWDDGFTMEASLEGSQRGLDGKVYPKNLTSFSVNRIYLKDGTPISAKSILGRYLRKRMGIDDLNYQITYEDLLNYGRDTITFSLIEEGLYYCDFSLSN